MKKARFIPITAIGALLSLTVCLRAQDIHFSQIYQAPMQLNPALTGAFMGNHRVILNYRSQWASVSPTSAFKTYAFGYDWTMFKKRMNNVYLGGGIFAFSDKAGTSQMGTTQLNLSFSSILSVDDNNRVVLGIQGGLAQRSADLYNPDLKWDSQYVNGGYSAANPSGEPAYNETFVYNDFSAGLSWHYGTDESNMIANNGIRLNAGIAFHHINKPSVELVTTDLDKLYSRWVGHMGANIGMLNTILALRPMLVYYHQGPEQEINGGMLLRYRVKEESKYTGLIKEMAVSGGAYYRFGDAVVPAVELEFSNFMMGFSYDLNTSALKAATNGRGGMEISLRFVSPNPFKYGKGSNSNARFL